LFQPFLLVTTLFRIKAAQRHFYFVLSLDPFIASHIPSLCARLRIKKIGMVGEYSPHSFRATGITRFLEEGGTLEAAQHVADHADSRTTKLYDRRGQKVLREDVERIRY